MCVFESEGNGRMCTTLPDVLVTVMGIEKVVPAWRDMDVFLQLLPRSSTGERMNPYTSFWTGVRPGDGPREFHLVLLDNGRTDVLADEVGRQALRCIRCSACLNVCPVYSRVGGHAYESVYPGPIGAILTPQLHGLSEGRSLPFASTLCGACYEVCPVEIDIPRVLVHLRGRVIDSDPPWRVEKAAMKGMYRVFASRRAFEAAQRAGRFGRPVRGRPAWPPARSVARLDLDSRPAPMPAETFRDWWRASAATRQGPRSATKPKLTLKDNANLSRMGWGRRPRTTATPGPPSLAASVRRWRTDRQRWKCNATIGERARRRTRRRSSCLSSAPGEYRATVLRAAPGDLPRVLGDLARGAGARRLAVPPDLPPEWRPDGVELLEDRGLSPRQLDALDGALTGCALAIAETGTIVLDGGERQGRRVLTLVPDYHLCVVAAESILELVPEAVGRLEAAVREGRPLTFVSGPSATSDIELSRVEGVHGPRTLNIVVAERA